jgi:hypothetical protein
MRHSSLYYMIGLVEYSKKYYFFFALVSGFSEKGLSKFNKNGQIQLIPNIVTKCITNSSEKFLQMRIFTLKNKRPKIPYLS